MTKLFIKLENLRLHYKVSGSGAPIILVHGWGADISCFAKLREYLSQQFTVYALDLPGFGLSAQPDKVWGSIEYARLIKKFIDELNIVEPILLGHSLGGKIVVHLVADDLIKAKKIILVGSSGVKLTKSFKVKAKIYFFKLLKILAFLPGINMYVRPRLDIYRKRVGSSDYRNACGIMRSILVKTIGENIVDKLSRIQIPVLLLWGDKDLETPLKAGQIMSQAILNSELKVIAGSGHFPFLDNWEEVVVALDKFLS